MNDRQKQRWWLALVLFSGFLLEFFLDLTGVELHQWIGIFGGGLALYHLLNHWGWVEAVTQRFFGRTTGKARLYYLLDASLFLGFSIMISTGVLISTWLNLAITGSALLIIHITASILTLLVTLVKLALHRKWLGATTRSIFARPQVTSTLLTPSQVDPLNRREFMKVMGVVSLTSLIALTSASRSLNLLDGNTTTSEETANTTSTSLSSSESNSSTSGCSIRCGKRCSYPGHCRKYTDTNNNGRCDLGECI